jgi:hypothetical protein
MATALPTELQPVVVAERVSRIKLVNKNLQNFFGFQEGGSNVQQVPLRTGTIDVFNDTREVASSVTPGSASNNIAPVPVGTFNYAIPQVFENELLSAEKLFNLRQVGSMNIDQYGMNYIVEQEAKMKQRLTNVREFQTAALLRGSYSYSGSGGKSAFTHSFSGGTYTVDYQVPSTNKTNINGIIGTSWANSAAPIIGDLGDIDAYSVELTGRGIRHAFCNWTMWQNVLSNTQVQNQSGSVNRAFERIMKDGDDEYTAILHAAPWLTFHINNNGLNLNGTFTKFFADTQISFCGDPDNMLASYYTCPTPIVEYDGAAVQGVHGEKVWYTSVRDPAAYALYSCLSGLPLLKLNKGIFNATAVF